MEKYILSIDQGTTSTRAILFNKQGENVYQSQKELTQYYPNSGWVEQDALEIYETVLEVITRIFKETKIKHEQVISIGITNQRETTVIWDKTTGEPIYNAIVWQSRQSNQICEDWIENNYQDLIYHKTGLTINPYFSASKIRWILDYAKEKETIEDNLLFGTIDTWLIWKLTGGNVHATDYTNASRTMLYNIYDLKWDEELLELFKIPKKILPKVLPSSSLFGYTYENQLTGLNFKTPISGVAGDQQAALFGQTCFNNGDIKNTYGTGCFMLMNTGKKPIKSKNGLLTTIAWGIDGEITYALEGSVFVAGSAIQWLRDGLDLITDSKESQNYAESVKDTNGVYMVPAFVGIGTPHWDNEARGAIFGLTRGTTKAHFIRAALESIAYSSKEVIEVMIEDSKLKFDTLAVDGGATINDFLMQFQSDLLNCKINRPKVLETTALGVAYLAGLSVGFWNSQEDIKKMQLVGKEYLPQMTNDQRINLYDSWKKAVKATMSFK